MQPGRGGRPGSRASVRGQQLNGRIRLLADQIGETMKVIDPVCKMVIDSEKAAATAEHQGQTPYFCRHSRI